MLPGEVQPASYRCPHCGETNDIIVDPSQGRQQHYIEDCQVCCRPNDLHLNYEAFTETWHVRAEPAEGQ